jgi:hypothetical protein
MSSRKDFEIVSADRLDRTRVMVGFSDGSYAIFSAEQLSMMSPDREQMADCDLCDEDDVMWDR